jgi:hypothetical protein
VNGGNSSSGHAYIGYDRKIFKDKLELSLNYNGSTNKSSRIVNDVLNSSLNIYNRVGGGLEYAIEKVFNIGFDYHFNYSTNSNKGTTLTETIIKGNELSVESNINFLKHYFTRADYNLTMNSSNSPNAKPYQIQMLNASAGYKFLKSKSELALIAHNILNQDNGYSIYQSATTITRTQNNVLGRYFMLSFTYNFQNKGASVKKEDDDD